MFGVLDRLRFLPEMLRYKLVPRIAHLALQRTTRSAQHRMTSVEPLRILIDNTVLDVAVTHEEKWIVDSKRSYVARVPVYGRNNDSVRHTQSSYLTGISHLARLGFARLYSSSELEAEKFRQPTGRFRGYGLSDYSLFRGIDIESIDGWVFPHIGPSWIRLPSPKEQQLARLRKSDDALFHDIYRLLAQQLGEKCRLDSWHIRTAQRYGMFCFLTTDRGLLLACKSLSRKEPLKSLTTRIMSPEELGKHLGIRPVKPYLLSYNDADWIFRMDHTMPEERRRKRSEYR